MSRSIRTARPQFLSRVGLQVIFGCLLVQGLSSSGGAQIHARWASPFDVPIKFDWSVPPIPRNEIELINEQYGWSSGLDFSTVETSSAVNTIYWERDEICGCVGETSATYDYSSPFAFPLIQAANIHFNSFHYNPTHTFSPMGGSFFFQGDPLVPWIYNTQYIFSGVALHEWGHFWGLTDNNFGGITCAMYGSFTFGTTRSLCASEIGTLNWLYFGI